MSSCDWIPEGNTYEEKCKNYKKMQDAYNDGKAEGCVPVIFMIGVLFLFVGMECWSSDKNADSSKSVQDSIQQCTPTALDVYRGRTKLNITSVNGEPVDSVVVFK